MEALWHIAILHDLVQNNVLPVIVGAIIFVTAQEHLALKRVVALVATHIV